MGFPISNFSRAGIKNGFLFMGFPISLERWFPISEVSYFAQFPISRSFLFRAVSYFMQFDNTSTATVLVLFYCTVATTTSTY